VTLRPASRAFLIVGTIAFESDGTMAKPLAPAEIRFSIAATWPSLSPSYLPAAVLSSMPSSSAFAWAPSRILTKKGLVSVLVIRPTMSAEKAGAAPAHSRAAPKATVVRVNFMIRTSQFGFPVALVGDQADSIGNSLHP